MSYIITNGTSYCRRTKTQAVEIVQDIAEATKFRSMDAAEKLLARATKKLKGFEIADLSAANTSAPAQETAAAGTRRRRTRKNAAQPAAEPLPVIAEEQTEVSSTETPAGEGAADEKKSNGRRKRTSARKAAKPAVEMNVTEEKAAEAAESAESAQPAMQAEGSAEEVEAAKPTEETEETPAGEAVPVRKPRHRGGRRRRGRRDDTAVETTAETEEVVSKVLTEIEVTASDTEETASKASAEIEETAAAAETSAEAEETAEEISAEIEETTDEAAETQAADVPAEETPATVLPKFTMTVHDDGPVKKAQERAAAQPVHTEMPGNKFQSILEASSRLWEDEVIVRPTLKDKTEKAETVKAEEKPAVIEKVSLTELTASLWDDPQPVSDEPAVKEASQQVKAGDVTAEVQEEPAEETEEEVPTAAQAQTADELQEETSEETPVEEITAEESSQEAPAVPERRRRSRRSRSRGNREQQAVREEENLAAAAQEETVVEATVKEGASEQVQSEPIGEEETVHMSYQARRRMRSVMSKRNAKAAAPADERLSQTAVSEEKTAPAAPSMQPAASPEAEDAEGESTRRSRRPERFRGRRRGNAVPLSEAQSKRRIFTTQERNLIYNRTEGHCGICGRFIPLEEYTVDHIIPLSKGGTNDLDNLQACCSFCNKAKDDSLGDDFFERIEHIFLYQAKLRYGRKQAKKLKKFIKELEDDKD